MNWHEYFTYDQATGNLIWKQRPREHFSSEKEHRRFNNRFAITSAGSKDTRGYVQVRINRRSIRAHRIVWQMFNGPIPEGIQIDHANGIINDNRIMNLRMATDIENAQNRKLNANNKTGIKGVRLNCVSGKYMAQISANGIKMHLGSFSTKGTAAVAYAKAALKLHGQFARFT